MPLRKCKSHTDDFDHESHQQKRKYDIYTDYVANLDSNGSPSSMLSCKEVCDELRKDLRTELRRRGLWTAPPRFLGYPGADWIEGDALEDLVQDAYIFNFSLRLRSLTNQLLTKDSIRGFVVINLRNLLTERQKDADPIGYRVFERLLAAVRQALETEALTIHGDKRAQSHLGNDTILGFRFGLEPLAALETLEEQVLRWNDDLLPDLITSQGRAVPKLLERLTQKIIALAADGVEAFRFGDLVGLMKSDVRRRWNKNFIEWKSDGPNSGSGFELDIDSKPVRVPVVDPRSAPDPESYMRLLRCTRALIERIAVERDRKEIDQLWAFVRSAAEENTLGTARPANAKLARLLGINRKRIPQLFEKLGKLIRQCQKDPTMQCQKDPTMQCQKDPTMQSQGDDD